MGSNRSSNTKAQHVRAPWGRAGTLYPGSIAEIYGRLAFIHFDDGDRCWAEVTHLVPPVSAGPDPAEACPRSAGQRVLAPWSDGRLYPGKVSEAYGKLVKITFDDGDAGWALADQTGVQADEAVVGAVVAAPILKRIRGVMVEQYGAMARVDVGGQQLWTEIEGLIPAGNTAPEPADRNPFTPGQRITAMYWGNGEIYPGVVDRRYGKLVFVRFDDGDEAWAAWEDCQPALSVRATEAGPACVPS